MQIKISYTATQLKGMLEGLGREGTCKIALLEQMSNYERAETENKSKHHRKNCQAGRDSKLYQ